MPPALILSSDSHVFEPPDLWTTRIDKPFRDRAPRMVRIDGADQLVVEADQVLSGIGLISNAGARFDAPETISGLGRFVERPPQAEGTQDSTLKKRLECFASDLLDDASKKHIAGIAVGPALVGLEVEPAAGVAAQEFVGIDRRSHAAIDEVERVVVGVT